MPASPQDFFWQLVADAGVMPWWFKAACAWAALVPLYHLPRHWEQYPLTLGLILVGLSPLLPPAGPLGDWLVYPFGVVLLVRLAREIHRLEHARAHEARRQAPPCCDHDVLLALDPRIRAAARQAVREGLSRDVRPGRRL